MTKIAGIKESPTFLALNDATRTALASVADARQFPAAAVAEGAGLYGRGANQMSETDNAAILPARSLDPYLFVLWHCKRAVRLYTEHSQTARACESFLTPYALAYVEGIERTGEVQPLQSEFTSCHQVFLMVVGELSYKVFVRVPSIGDTNQSRFPTDKPPCSCGLPAIDHIPCGHMSYHKQWQKNFL